NRRSEMPGRGYSWGPRMRKALAAPVVRAGAAGPAHGEAPAAALGRAYDAYRAGDFAAARREAEPLLRAPLANRDYVLYVVAQSAMFLGAPADALPLYRELAGLDSRFAQIAPWRAADA